MRTNRCYTILVLTLLWASAAYSQENRSEVMVDFRVNSTRIDPTYGNNAERIREITGMLQGILNDTTVEVTRLSFCVVASPEGSYEWNRQLANGRMKALETLVRSKIEVSDSIITYDDNYIAWDYLAERVSESEMAHKHEILSILGEKPEIVKYRNGRNIDSRIPKLQRLDGGRVWDELFRRFFSPMRNASMVIVTFKQVSPPPVVVPEPVIEEVEVSADTTEAVLPAPVIVDTVPDPTPAVKEWGRKLYVKTNALGLGLAIANTAVEIDLCRHWSFNLPVYYSAWNYFKSTVKFRTAMIQPEIRYWFKDDNDGWYAGGHIGIGHYNVATNGEYRTQDHEGKSPALGGGLAVGYRLPISGNKRWKMEFSIGAGAYKLHHDKFRNYHNGLLVYTEKKTYVGIDQAAVSFSYTFDLKKKGGAR